MSRIPANAFQGFTILRLVLNRNTLGSIDDQAFSGALLDSLVELDLVRFYPFTRTRPSLE